VITAPVTVAWGGVNVSYKKGDVIEAPSALAALIGGSARTLTITPGLAHAGTREHGRELRRVQLDNLASGSRNRLRGRHLRGFTRWERAGNVRLASESPARERDVKRAGLSRSG
jgi:hypothetical protein